MPKTVRILVVDRSRFSRDTLAQVLRSQVGNAEVATSESAAAAIDYIASGQRVDLITTALALADMDGVDLVVVRFAGEEFCALLSQADARALHRTAADLLGKVAKRQMAGVDVGVSIGAASAADFPDADLNGLMTRADKALSKAKSEGRGRVYLHTREGLEVV